MTFLLCSSSAHWLSTRKSHSWLAQRVCHRGRRWNPGTLRKDRAPLWDPAHGRGSRRESVSVSGKNVFGLITAWHVALVKWHQCILLSVHRLVFSQSLISLDLIEDFLELACRAKDEDKPSPYKGKFLLWSHTFCLFLKKFSLYSTDIPVNLCYLIYKTLFYCVILQLPIISFPLNVMIWKAALSFMMC